MPWYLLNKLIHTKRVVLILMKTIKCKHKDSQQFKDWYDKTFVQIIKHHMPTRNGNPRWQKLLTSIQIINDIKIKQYCVCCVVTCVNHKCSCAYTFIFEARTRSIWKIITVSNLWKLEEIAEQRRHQHTHTHIWKHHK